MSKFWPKHTQNVAEHTWMSSRYCTDVTYNLIRIVITVNIVRTSILHCTDVKLYPVRMSCMTRFGLYSNKVRTSILHCTDVVNNSVRMINITLYGLVIYLCRITGLQCTDHKFSQYGVHFFTIRTS